MQTLRAVARWVSFNALACAWKLRLAPEVNRHGTSILAPDLQWRSVRTAGPLTPAAIVLFKPPTDGALTRGVEHLSVPVITVGVGLNFFQSLNRGLPRVA